MIRLNAIDRHPSSRLKMYSDPNLLAKRTDLYTGDDFYFGFESSNHTFLDIIGDKQPLAIKHGPTLSLYQKTVEGGNFSMYYIDAKNHTLIPIVSISTKPGADINDFLPLSFTDFYLEQTLHSDKKFKEEEKSENEPPSPEESLGLMVEQLATNNWPQFMDAIPATVKQLCAKYPDLSIELTEIEQLKAAIETTQEQSTAPYLAPYNPFNDTIRINFKLLAEKNPEQITVRHINNKDARIEIISPKSDRSYTPIYKNSSPQLYQQFQDALSNATTMASLLEEHYPELVSAYQQQKPGLHA